MKTWQRGPIPSRPLRGEEGGAETTIFSFLFDMCAASGIECPQAQNLVVYEVLIKSLESSNLSYTLFIIIAVEIRKSILVFETCFSETFSVISWYFCLLKMHFGKPQFAYLGCSRYLAIIVKRTESQKYSFMQWARFT